MNYEEYTKRKGKEEAPENTVDKICMCLNEIDAACGFRFYDTDVDGCYSARVFLKGELRDTVAANGKGSSAAYCLASGFAELIERIQNQIFFPYQLTESAVEDIIVRNPVSDTSLCQYWTLKEMREDKNSFLNKIVHRYADSIKGASSEAEKELLVWLQLDRQFPLWKKTGVLTVPFYHVQTGEYEWLPVEMIKLLNLSNGMAAGNTLPEALVQGYSEIFERYAQCRIVAERLTPPQIERDVLKSNAQIFGMIQKIEAMGPYRVVVMDCSLGMGLPVVCGAIINREKQTFGIRFGAHPDIRIALERVFTEAMQGKSLEEFAGFNRISFNQKKILSQQNLFNLLKTGGGFYPPEILGKTPSYKPAVLKEMPEMSNSALLRKMTEQISSMCSSLYIADVSYLGFPSVLIYAENISEIIPADYTVLKSLANKNEAAGILQDISSMDENKAQKLRMAAHLVRNSVLENTIDAMCRMPLKGAAHGGNDQTGFLMAVCSYFLGEDAEAAKRLGECIQVNEQGTEEYEYEETLLKFFQGMSAYKDAGKVKEMLHTVCNENIVEQVFEDFSSRQIVFSKLYSCKDTSKEFPDFYERLYLKMLNSPVWTQNLHRVFGEKKPDSPV